MSFSQATFEVMDYRKQLCCRQDKEKSLKRKIKHSFQSSSEDEGNFISECDTDEEPEIQEIPPKQNVILCVTLTSSEDEECIPLKRRVVKEKKAKKSQTNDKEVKSSSQEHHQHPSKSVLITKSIEQLEHSEELKWKESGLNGNFVSVTCRSVWVGTYKTTPKDRILFSPEGIVIEVPAVITKEISPSEETVKLVLSNRDIVSLEACLSNSQPVIFLYLSPLSTRDVRRLLRMRKGVSGVWFKARSNNETHKRLILFPDGMTDQTKSEIQQVFSVMSFYKKISSEEALRIVACFNPLNG